VLVIVSLPGFLLFVIARSEATKQSILALLLHGLLRLRSQ
jgi:hypothetical protein